MSRPESVAEWAAAGRETRYRGYPIFVRSSGQPGAEPLLLIHGFPTASWDWEALWPALTERFRVYTLDLIGFGLSAKPTDYEYSLFDQANLCEAYLTEEGVHSYHVLAHDYGDSVAQELLARRREPGERPKLLSVAFLNGGLFPETHRPVPIQRLLLSPLGPLVSRMTSRARLALNMRRIFGPESQPDDGLIDAFWFLITTNNGQAVMHRLIRYMVERREHRVRWVGALQGSDVPLKLIDGTLDPISGAHMVARYRELVPRADVTVLDRIGHYPQVEAPGAVLAAYLKFRTDVNERSRSGMQSIVHVALVVRDYDEAIAFYTKKMNFTLVEDTYQPEQDKRWVVVAPPGSRGTSVLLAKASKAEQEPFIGNQTGGRVFLFLNTDDFWRDYTQMVARGITFVREPRSESYGTVAVFKDLYGNLWDLLELKTARPDGASVSPKTGGI